MANNGATYKTQTPEKMQHFVNASVNYTCHRLITRLELVAFINVTPFLCGTVQFKALAHVENKLC